MSLHQFFSILRARRFLAAMILLGTLALAVGWILLRPAHYTARAPVLVDVRTDPVGAAALQGMIAPSFVATQIDISKSDRVAQRVVEMLRIDKQPDEIQRWRDETQGRGSPQAWFAHELQAALDVKPAREPKPLERLRARHLVDEVQVDVQELLADLVVGPDLVEHRARGGCHTRILRMGR